MRKSFLLKMFILIIALAAVLSVIIVATRNSFRTGTIQVGQTQTLFEQFVIGGGPIVWFVLLPMSVVMVFLAAEHSLTIRRSKLLPEGIDTEVAGIIRQFGPERLETEFTGRDDFISAAAVKAVAKGGGDWFRMRTALAESLQEQASGLLRKIEWLNLIGNVSPMVGLFGTVFGMIKLFNAIVLAGGQPQPAQLAGGISVALVTTFWGLFIAIPALAIHSVFRNRIEALASDAAVKAENVIPVVRRSLEDKKQAEQSKLKQPIRELRAKSAKKVRESLTSL